MVVELTGRPMSATLQGIGHALERAIPFAASDSEERAERHELRKIEIGKAVRR